MDNNTIARITEKLNEKFPLGIPRNKIGIATGYVLSSKTMSNADSLGCGIPGKFKVGRNIIYPVKNVVDFIISRENNLMYK